MQPELSQHEILIRRYGVRDYAEILEAMQTYTQSRNSTSPDELWCLQHPPVYTLGLNGKEEHLLNKNNIDMIKVDRGGQITYHGPGQIIIYTLIDLPRHHSGVKQLVENMEQAIIDLLSDYGIHGGRKKHAPGVYVDGAKIAALGLRVKKGCSYHGLAFNIDMDLGPFGDINPCGYSGLAVTQLADLLEAREMPTHLVLENQLLDHLCRLLGYNAVSETPPTD